MCVFKVQIENVHNNLLRLIQKVTDILGDGNLNLQKSKVDCFKRRFDYRQLAVTPPDLQRICLLPTAVIYPLRNIDRRK